MKKKKTRNPLIRRIPRELAGDWRKYLLVSLFLILTIGFVSGMYVANESMMKAADEGVTKYKLEDGHFELNEEADQTLLAAIATGEKADVKQYYTDKAKRELDEKFDDEFEDKFKEKQSSHKFTVTGILLDKGKNNEFSLKKFCKKIYRTSEMCKDDIELDIMKDRR